MGPTKSIYVLDRRDWIQYMSAGGALALTLDFEQLEAASICEKVQDIADPSKVFAGLSPQNSSDLMFWIDGMTAKKLISTSDQRGRMRISTYVDLPHDANKHVDSVFLLDEAGKIIDLRKFRPETSYANSQGRAPYAVFENLEIPSGGMSIAYLYKDGTNGMKFFKYTLAASEVRASRFDYSHLSVGAKSRIPAQFIQDIVNGANHNLTTAVGATPFATGVHTSPYQTIAFAPHSPRAKLMNVDSDGNFEMDIEPMHGDVDGAHFMRYFLVMDPVGQILGCIKRVYGDETYVNNGSSLKVKKGFLFGKAGTVLGQTGFTEADLTNAKNRNILDCPFIRLGTEDIRDAFATISVRIK
jgi:hypothetical protein